MSPAPDEKQPSRDQSNKTVVIRMRVHAGDLQEMARLALRADKPLSTWMREQAYLTLQAERARERASPTQRPTQRGRQRRPWDQD